MADKIITDLQLIDEVEDTAQFPMDDGVQTYRASGPKLFSYMRGKHQASRTISAGSNALTSDDVIVLLNPTGGGFTQALPAVASLPTGFTIRLKNIATNGNTVVLDANSTELIDNAETLTLKSSPFQDAVTLFNTGSKWVSLSGKLIEPAGVTRDMMAVGAYAKKTIISAQTGTYAALATDDIIPLNGTFTVNLPAASTMAGRCLHFVNIGTGIVTIDADGTELISGVQTILMGEIWETMKIICDGSAWWIIDRQVPRGFTTQIVLDTPNGHGSTNTKIRKYTNNSVSGNGATYAASATNGDSMTIVLPGKYEFGFSDQRSGAGWGLGVSKNSNQLTTDIQSITASHIVLFMGMTNGYSSMWCTDTGAVGDVYRPHGDGAPGGTDDGLKFVMRRIGF